jgi:hypothetical protein
MFAAIFDGGRRETRFFATLAVLLVLIRAAAFTLSERINFNSDQAIVGLMAKHLSEFRRFPFFYYDQNYMLAVQAWIMAPFFWIARPSVTVMRIPLVMLNVAAAVILVRLLASRLRLRPVLAFVAALPFIIPTPLVASSFLDTLGSSGVEPLIYLLILWVLRDRPVAFGALLAFGFLHREFTLYAVPALVVINAADGSLWTAAAARWMGRMVLGFALVWVALNFVRLQLDGLSLLLQAQMTGSHICFRAAELADRIRYVAVAGLPALVGGTTMPLAVHSLRSSAVVGSPVIGWLILATMALMLLRLGWAWRRPAIASDIGFGVYLALIGCCTLAAYSLTCNLVLERPPLIRYINLALLLPIGCFAVFMAREPDARVRSLAVMVFLLWGLANLADNVRVMRETYVHPHPDPHRELTDFLLNERIRYARADYWDAYVVDFLSRERIIVSSTTLSRIPEYERRVDEHSDAAVRVERLPCEGQMYVAAWCIQLPGNRAREGGR